MKSILIYYQTNINESSEKTIENINDFIRSLNYKYSIKHVFIEKPGEENQLLDLIQSPLNKIDILFIRFPIKEEFDNKLLYELSKSEQFKINIIDI